MMRKRQNDRVSVNLPATFVAEHEPEQARTGIIDDLSISGMKVNLPVPFAAVKSRLIDFVLELPLPFKTIRGHAEIQWKRWDTQKKSTTCGLKLSPLTLQHLLDLDTIISEVKEETIAK